MKSPYMDFQANVPSNRQMHQCTVSALNMDACHSFKILNATAINAYDKHIVLVKRNLDFNQEILIAGASFRIENTLDDCNFLQSHGLEIDWYYYGSVLTIGIILVLHILLHIIFICRSRARGPV